MKWRVVILDPAAQMEMESRKAMSVMSQLKKDTYVVLYARNHTDFFNTFMYHHGRSDKIAILYDGHVLLDGVANQADWATSNNGRAGHLTKSVCDNEVTGNMPAEVINSFFYEFLKRFCFDAEYAEDEMTLEQKRALIETLKA
jgi:hypothetical protein